LARAFVGGFGEPLFVEGQILSMDEFVHSSAPQDQAGAQHSQSPMEAEIRAVMRYIAMSGSGHKAKCSVSPQISGPG
jgi:hypothetical protein